MTKAIQPEPGLHLDVPAEIYHRDPSWLAMSNSQLKHLLRSPAHLRAYQADRGDPPPSRQKAFDIGTAVHTAVLEPHLLEETVAAKPPGDGRTKRVKDAIAKMRAENPDIILLSEAEVRQVTEIASSVHDHPTAGPFVESSVREVSLLWRDFDSGVLCKGRADGWNEDIGVVVDLKTTRDASYNSFKRDVYRLGYHIQNAFYCLGFAELGQTDVAYVIVAVEKEPPYATVVYELDPLWLSVAETVIDSLLGLYAACLEKDRWPAYSGTVVGMPMDQWAVDDAEVIVERLDGTARFIREGGVL